MYITTVGRLIFEVKTFYEIHECLEKLKNIYS